MLKTLSATGHLQKNPETSKRAVYQPKLKRSQSYKSEDDADIANFLFEGSVDINIGNEKSEKPHKRARNEYGCLDALKDLTVKQSELNNEGESSSITQIDVPGDNSCLFWSIALAYLIPAKDNKEIFLKRCEALFGSEKLSALEEIKRVISSYNPESGYVVLRSNSQFANLVAKTFRNRVVDYILRYREEYKGFINVGFDSYLEEMRKPSTWGGEPEIRAMSNMLNASIVVFGASVSNYGENDETKIKLFHVNAADAEGERNHYKFGLEQNVIDSYKLQKELGVEGKVQQPSDTSKQPEQQLPNPIRASSDLNVDQYSFINISKPSSDLQSQPKTTADRVVRWSGWYTEKQIKANPNILFLFGDNDKAKYRIDKSNPGGGGQAKATRPTGNGKLPFDRLAKDGGLNGNAIGITTTFYDGYTPSIDEFKALMDKEFEPIEIWVKAGGSVIIPCDDKGNHSLGTGIADLKNKVPGGIEYIQSKIDNLVKSVQQPIQNPQSKSLDTLKQELHDTLSKERQFFQLHQGLQGYLSSNQLLVQQQIQPKRVKPVSESEEPSAKKVKLSRTWELHTNTQGVKRLEDDIPRIDPKRQSGSEMYAASGVKSALHGTVYQLKLLMLFLKRGINEGYSFRLATEMDAAEKFDDVVFQCNESNKKVYRYLQAKHKQCENKTIGVGDLLTKEKNGEFRLAKYFISYLKIKNNQYFVGSTMGDFTLCTNIGFDLDQDTGQNINKKLKIPTRGQNTGKKMFVKIVNEDDVFFKDGGDRYKFSYVNNNMISEMKPVFQGALEVEIGELRDKTKKLREKIEKLEGKSDQDLRKELEQAKRELEISQNWQNAFKQVLKDGLEDSIKEFFDKLIFAVNQPNEVELAEIITKDLGEEFNGVDSKNVYARFQEEMLNWMKEKEGHFLTDEDGKEFFIRMKEEILGGFRFDVRSPVPSFTGRSRELGKLKDLMQTSQNEPAVISQLASVSGLGGIGKTELARKYIKENSKYYDNNIIWINAETYATMEQSFLKLAKNLLGIPIKERSTESIVIDVYVLFARRKSLFIFDNAEKLRSEGQDNGISQFLPTNFSLPPGANKPNVLITSRNKEWGEIEVLELDVWKETEAIEFVRKSLGAEQEEDIRKLVKELGCFPLALQQAVAYIKEEDKIFRNIGKRFKISDYLEKYKEKAQELLDFSFPDNSWDRYAKTVFTTWQVTIDLIRTKKHGKEAIEILEMMSYFAPNDIDSGIFSGLIPNDEILGSAISLLKQYSMVSSGERENIVNIHRLVQQVIRLRLKSKNQESEILERILKLIAENFEYCENHEKARDLNHTMCVWEYSSKYNELVKKFEVLPYNIIEQLNFHLRYREAEIFGKEALKNLSKEENFYERNFLLYEVAKTLSNRGKHEEALNRFQELRKEQAFICSCDMKVRLFNSIASEYCSLGDYKSALFFCELAEDGLHVSKEKLEPLFNIVNRPGSNISALGKREFAQYIVNLVGSYDHRNQIKHFISVIRAKAKILIELGSYRSASEMLHKFVLNGELIINVTDRVNGNNHNELTCMSTYNIGHMETKYLIALAEFRSGNYSCALACLQNLLGVQENSKVEYSSILSTKHLMAAVLAKQKKYIEARKIFKDVLKERAKLLGKNHPDTLSTRHEMALLFLSNGEDKKALEELNKVLKGREKVLKEYHPDTLMTRCNIAMICHKQGNHENALQICEEIIVEAKKVLRASSPDVLAILHSKASILNDTNKCDEALKIFRKVFRLQNDTLGPNHPDTLKTQRSIALALYRLNRYREVQRVLYQNIERRIDASYTDYSDMLATNCFAALMWLKSSEIEDSLYMLRSIFQKQEELGYSSALVTRYFIAYALYLQGNQQDALNTFQEVYDKSKKLFGPDNLCTLKAYRFIELIKVKHNIQHYGKQQKAFLGLSKFVSYCIPYAKVELVKQGLYLSSFAARNVKIKGKCTAITRGLSQALLSQSGKSFLSNLATSAKIYERIAQGKQISKREEIEAFAFSKLLNDFEGHRDSGKNSLHSSLIHNKGYKTFSDLSNYIAGIKGDFAIHLVTSNHVVAIYRIGNNYAYFDSNAAFVSGLKGVDQLVQVVEKGIKSAGYEMGEKGLFVEHFDVDKANSQLSNEDKRVLAEEIKTERQLLAEQDKELGLIKINGQELSRVQLYDFGTKINVEGGVPLLINADMNLSSKKFQDHLDRKEVSMTAREYLDSLKNGQNMEEVVQATKVIPFIGSRREIEEAEQTRRPKQSLSKLAKGAINHVLATVAITSVSRSETKTGGSVSDLSSVIVDKQLKRSPGH